MSINNYKTKKISYAKIWKYISIALVIMWMMIVFWFSSKDGRESKIQSGNTIKKIVTVQSTVLNTNVEKDNNIIETLQPIIRKLAHFTLYTLGGFIIFNMMNNFKIKKIYQIICSLGIGIIYAITDEIHQLFVPQRSGRVFDVFIDSCGVATGILIFIIILVIFKIVCKIYKNDIKTNKG